MLKQRIRCKMLNEVECCQSDPTEKRCKMLLLKINQGDIKMFASDAFLSFRSKQLFIVQF